MKYFYFSCARKKYRQFRQEIAFFKSGKKRNANKKPIEFLKYNWLTKWAEFDESIRRREGGKLGETLLCTGGTEGFIKILGQPVQQLFVTVFLLSALLKNLSTNCASLLYVLRSWADMQRSKFSREVQTCSCFS